MYLSLRTSDIYENRVTKVQFNPIKTEKDVAGGEFLIIKNVDSNEEIKITLNDFRNNCKLVKSGSLKEKAFFI